MSRTRQGTGGKGTIPLDGCDFDINRGFWPNHGPQDTHIQDPLGRSYADTTLAGPEYPHGPRAQHTRPMARGSSKEDIPNPYLKNLDLEASKEVTTKDLQKTFAGILEPLTNLPKGLCMKTFKLNRSLVASRVAHL